MRFSSDTDIFTDRYKKTATTWLRKYAEWEIDAPHPKNIAEKILKLLKEWWYTHVPLRTALDNIYIV